VSATDVPQLPANLPRRKTIELKLPPRGGTPLTRTAFGSGDVGGAASLGLGQGRTGGPRWRRPSRKMRAATAGVGPAVSPGP